MIACDKVIYTTYNEAQAAISGLADRGHKSFKVYKCRECKQFHLTSIKKKKLRPEKHRKYKFDINDLPKQKNVVAPGKFKAKLQKAFRTKTPAATHKALSPEQIEVLKKVKHQLNK